mmetsp:Transcript_11524/g.27066  ORF Transcript_11524/g.27066 Transcript_11524/m.27066 type:complete len:580 (-) Transcript_11524:45-1784(-)
MNQFKSNSSIESLCRSEKESLPFAIEEHFPSREERNCHNRFHEFSEGDSKPDPIQSGTACLDLNSSQSNLKHSVITTISQNSLPSSPPDLVESDTTDGTSCCSGVIPSSTDVTKSINYQIPSTSTMLPSSMVSIQMSSFFSAASVNSIPCDPTEGNRIPDNDEYCTNNHENTGRSRQSLYDNNHAIIPQPQESSCSIGFSQLMRAADDSDTQLGQSGMATSNLTQWEPNARLSPLLENQGFEAGALISAATEYSSTPNTTAVEGRTIKDRAWWYKLPLLGRGCDIANRELDAPLLTRVIGSNSDCTTSNQQDITCLLSSSNSLQRNHENWGLNRTIANIQTNIESDDSFEVSLFLTENSRCTVDDVIEVISNTELLSLWCDPVGTLIVTSNSNINSSSNTTVDERRSKMGQSTSSGDSRERTREYEGEWIEATTSALESPSGTFTSILGLGQSVLESLGCASYGRVTIFTERRRGHICLTIGPFHGGIYASHSIFVSSDGADNDGGRIRIVDRVRLTRDDDDEETLSIANFFGCSVISSVSQCFFPSIVGYVGQVTTSLGRLRILLENNKNSISAGRHS